MDERRPRREKSKRGKKTHRRAAGKKSFERKGELEWQRKVEFGS